MRRSGEGLAHVRLKDLRRTWAADQAGLNLDEMKAGMGHAKEATTVRYTNRQVTLDPEAAKKVGAVLGLIRAA